MFRVRSDDMSPTVSWCVVFLLTPAFTVGTNVTFTTVPQTDDPNLPGEQYNFVSLLKYGFTEEQTTSLTFQVLACNDAVVGLTETAGDYSTAYIIAIGGWGNTGNWFAYRHQDQEQTRVTVNLGQPLDCNAYRTFQVSWQKYDDIQVRTIKNGAWQTIAAGWTILPPFQIRAVGLTTALWSTGFWKFVSTTYKAPKASVWTTLPRFESVSMTKGILWKMAAVNRGMCGLLCHADANCWSFVYDVTEKTCQGHDDIFAIKDDDHDDDHDGADATTSSSSYFVLLG